MLSPLQWGSHVTQDLLLLHGVAPFLPAAPLLCARPPIQTPELPSSRMLAAAPLHPDTSGRTLGPSLLFLSMTAVSTLLVNLGADGWWPSEQQRGCRGMANYFLPHGFDSIKEPINGSGGVVRRATE